jgi:hypothetical protein
MSDSSSARAPARLNQFLLEDGVDRWVVVTGVPGMGKR